MTVDRDHASRRRVRALGLAVMLLAVTALLAGPRPAAASAPYPTGPGYWLAARDGGIFGFGDAQFFGSTGSIRLNQPMVGIAPHPFLEGYWMVARDGGIFAFGSSGFHGSTGSMRLVEPVVGMAAHPSGLGYWLVASDGGVFAFGAARFHGSTGSLRLRQPIVGMAAHPSGEGYWLVARDGGIFAFGAADFKGSTGSINLAQPIVGMTAHPSGNGYWMVARDGGVFAFNAPFEGSTGGRPLNEQIVGMAATPTGSGYWLVARDGGMFSFNAPFLGSMGGRPLNQPVVGMAARPPLAIAADPFADGAGRASDWKQIAGDWQLEVAWSSGAPAGARVLGVEGLSVGQLGRVGFTQTAGACTASGPMLVLSVDTNGDGGFDTTRSYKCSGVAPSTVSFDPVAGGPGAAALPANAHVTGLDLVWGSPGTARVDNISAAGITVSDYRTFTAVGTTYG